MNNAIGIGQKKKKKKKEPKKARRGRAGRDLNRYLVIKILISCQQIKIGNIPSIS